MRNIVVLLLTALLCSCGGGAEITCKGTISFTGRTPTEISAMRDALAKSRERCGPEGHSCDVRTSKNDNGQILVGVHYLVLSESAGKCAQRIGDETLYVYGKDGQYIESIPGM
jgi:hypothetical protein